MTEQEQLRLRVRQGKDPRVFPQTASRVGLYQRCPRWFAYEYGAQIDGQVLVEKLPRVRGAAAELGDRFHRLAALIDEGADPQEAGDLLAVPAEMWERWARLREAAAGLVNPAMRQHIAGVEETIRWRFPLAEGREAEVEARIDRLYLFPDDSAGIDDYKTGSPFGLPKRMKELRRSPQLLTYGQAVNRSYPRAWQFDCALIFPESGEIRRVVLDWDDIDHWSTTLTAITQEMADDIEFRPKPGSCQLCPYALSHCPVGQQLLKMNGRFGPLVDEEAAKALALYLQYIDGVSKQIKALLEEWVTSEGAINIGEKTYGRHSTESMTIPLDALPDAIRVLRQAGVSDDSDEMPVRWDGWKGYQYLQGDEAIPELQEMAERTWRHWTGFRNSQGGRRRSRRGSNSY